MTDAIDSMDAPPIEKDETSMTSRKTPSKEQARDQDMKTPDAQEKETKSVVRPTVSHMLGEMTWLLQQSRMHRHFSIGDMEWMIMPPLMLEQYRIFRGNPDATNGNSKDNENVPERVKPLGFALWAMLSEEAEQKLNDMVLNGRGPARLRPDEWRSGDRLWLVDLAAPFATVENRYLHLMLSDLVGSLNQERLFLKDCTIKLHKTDPSTGSIEIVNLRIGDA